MMFSTNRPGRPRAFTLMEMVMVLAIIAIILGMGVGLMKNVLGDAHVQQAEAMINQLDTALVRYKTQAEHFPTEQQGLEALVTKPGSNPQPKRWSQKMEAKALIDPWGNPFRYRIPGKINQDGFDIWSAGLDGQDGTEDDVGNW